MYVIIHNVIGHIEDQNGSKYLVFDSTDENKEALKKYTEFCDEIEDEIETINGGKAKSGDYGKDFMKIKFNSDDDLPLNKRLKFPAMTIVVRSVPQIYLDECLYDL